MDINKILYSMLASLVYESEYFVYETLRECFHDFGT